jgi:uncharacterized protein YgbK (DUF1537 family)
LEGRLDKASRLLERNDVPSIEPPSRARTFIIADDLTGACDAAVAFSRAGVDTEVLLDMEHSVGDGPEVRAICTETRNVPVEQAIGTLQRVAHRQDLGHYEQIFKKIDSVFRGNTFHEIKATIDVFHNYLAVIAPAYPALGRTSSDGMLRVRDIAGESSIPVRERLHAIGLHPRWIAPGHSAQHIEQQMSQSLREGNRAVFCDANTAEDLQSIVRAARAMQTRIPTRILWIGSAGLAHALADHLPIAEQPLEHPTDGAVLIFSGSDHPVTQRQIAALHEQHEVFIWPTVDSGKKPTDSIIVFRIERGHTTEEEIRAAVSSLMPQTISCLFLTGGDTAMLVCRALGIHSLRLHHEFEPGIPQATAEGGLFAGCTVILKSGGFGSADVLCRIAKHFNHQKEAIL